MGKRRKRNEREREVKYKAKEETWKNQTLDK